MTKRGGIPLADGGNGADKARHAARMTASGTKIADAGKPGMLISAALEAKWHLSKCGGAMMLFDHRAAAS